MTDLYSWVCPDCHRFFSTVTADQVAGGLQVDCPVCGGGVTVPDDLGGGQQELRRGAQ
ncbi:MAG: hypothetical protein ABEH77_00490 [Halobacteriaceae archaeon]